MALQYPKENRMFEDMENSNKRIYRESEAHAKINYDKAYMREDFGFEKQLYEETHDPNQTYQEIQSKMYRSEMNIDQRHFPMLREYEKAKLSLANHDIEGAGDSQAEFPVVGNDRNNSPFSKFMRATTGKKLYFNSKAAGPLPPSRVTDNTKKHKARERILYNQKNEDLTKMTKTVDFIPSNPGEARKAVQTSNGDFHHDEYDRKRNQEVHEHQIKSNKMLAGHFKFANHYDNGREVDQFGILKRTKDKIKKGGNQSTTRGFGKSLQDEDEHNMSTRSQSHKSFQRGPVGGARLRNTNDKYENTMNQYATFLNDKSELPRLSILDNYKQIMRIMTNSYIKGSEYQDKFKNRMEKDIINDEEYQKFKEEQTNTKKMSTIVKSLNAPFRRSKMNTLGQSGQNQMQNNQNKYSQSGSNDQIGGGASSNANPPMHLKQQSTNKSISTQDNKFINSDLKK